MTKRAHYQVTNFIGLWWDEKRGKWVPQASRGCSSHRKMPNGKEAWRHYREVGIGFVLLKFFYKGGIRYMEERMHYPEEAATIFAKCRKCRKSGCCMDCWWKILPYLKNRED